MQKERTPSKWPRIVEMPSQTMAVIRTVGDPSVVAEQGLGVLYKAVYALKFALKKQGADFKVTGLRARWPNAHIVPKDQWLGIWGLPIPEGATQLQQEPFGADANVEMWHYGTVAENLHVGPYDEEMPAVQALHSFITESGYEVAGEHEEEYLTSPRAKVQRTVIRYPIKKA